MATAFSTKEVFNPRRLRVFDAGTDKWRATFTWGSYTVTLSGPERTLAETYEAESGGAKAVRVTHSTWVRVAPGPFVGPLDETWLQLALAANQNGVPDVLALAMQYLKGAEPQKLGEITIAGEAKYGKLLDNGDREEGADFNDFLGLRWDYPSDPPDWPEEDQFGCLDCSGFMRMIWGFRGTLPGTPYKDRIPLSIKTQMGATLPRTSFQMYAEGPGIIIIPNGGTPPSTAVVKQQLRVGDLVFFDQASDPGVIDHLGMYVGRDEDDRLRFVSSRQKNNGPTMGDFGGASVLDGSGYWAKNFRAARRV